MAQEKSIIEKIKSYNEKHGRGKTMVIILQRCPFYIDYFINKISGVSIFNCFRKICIFFINMHSPKKPRMDFICDEKYNLNLPKTNSYRNELKYYLSKKQYFDEYLDDNKNETKEKIDIKIGAYLQCFNQEKATFETLKSFRSFFPDRPVMLLSDGGKDFSRIAKYFKCHYEYSEKNIKYWPCLDMLEWFRRLSEVCNKFIDCDWIILLEDDIRVRDFISKMPRGHLCGQGGGNGLKKGKQISKQAKKFLLEKYPQLEINGISGCGGSIFHRETFLECYKNIKDYDIKKLKSLDNGLSWATDFALTFLFLMNGKIVRRWLDLSEEETKNFGPASAFDHQFKKYYKEPLSEDDIRELNKI